jgi:Anti-sigma factor NepR
MAENSEKSNHRNNSGKNVKNKAKTMNGYQQSTAAPAIQDMLGAKLKAYYGEIVSEPIPDRLMALMAELEAQSATKTPSEPDAENGGDI